MSSLDDIPPVPKVEHSDDEDFEDSSPEAEDHNLTQEVAQVQKRKGGRKPIYATSEERKQRNRQAQAAFRERRTEYIKQLETTIKHHEEQLQSLQQSHRSAADECLMLRYKNSLLERILLEKGVDVQAELKMKTESSHILPHPSSQGHAQPSPVQRAVMNRQGQTRRSGSASASKPIRPHAVTSHPPPRLQPTPPSVTLSPSSASSPHPSGKAAIRSASGDLKNQKQRQQVDHRQQHYQNASKMNISTTQNNSGSHANNKNGDVGSAGSSTNFYPSPFQAHIDQLEQEYDAQADMLDEENPSENSIGHGQYPQQYQQQAMANQHMQMGMQGQPPMHGMHGMQPIAQPQVSQAIDPNNPTYGVANPGFDPYDPSLDADPFGLTASMHFPTQFTFQESSMRR